MEVPYQELNQYGVSAMKHERIGGAAYTLVKSPYYNL